MRERDVFPLRLRQSTNAAIARILFPVDGVSETHPWVKQLKEGNGHEIFGRETDAIRTLYKKRQE